MTEQQEVQPSAAASVADNKQPGQKVNNKKSSSGAVVGGIAILLALGRPAASICTATRVPWLSRAS